jgi:hypothetical protein
VVRESWGDPRKLVFRYERWQLEDGSQARTISHWEAEGPLEGTTSEEVVTRTQTLSYLPATAHEPARIIRYRASDDFASIPEDPPPFEAPAIGGTPEVGDPRTLPDRAARGDADVTQLPDGTVRDIPVQQFEVGDCAEPAKRERTSDGNGVVTTVPQRATVALARDTHVPVRVTIEPCSEELPAGLETRVLDFVTFEELPHTPGNLEQLELSPHPGVPIKDGIAIDKAEERDEAGPQPSATPVATPDAGAGR